MYIQSGSKVGTFINEGSINTKNFAIQLNKGTIDNFQNTGTIASTDTNSSYGVALQKDSKVGTFSNSGSISGVSLNHVPDRQWWAGSNGKKVTINNFTNSGTISNSKTKSLSVRHTDIKTLTNSGLIKNVADLIIKLMNLIILVILLKEELITIR